MARLQWSSARTESQTTDEATHLAAGYVALIARDFRLSPEHPPFGRMLQAIPLLQSARLVGIALTVILGLLIAAFAARHFGWTTAVFAVALMAFDPLVLAHGHYVTTDLSGALTFFITISALLSFLRSPRVGNATLLGPALGLALSTKFSNRALLLPPILLGFRHWRLLILAAVSAFLAIYAVYAFETRPILSETHVAADFDRMPVARDPKLRAIAGNVPLPAFSFWRGWYRLLDPQLQQTRVYLNGKVRPVTPWYFLLVYPLKAPIVQQILLFLSAAAGLVLWRRSHWRKAGLHWLVLVCFAATFVSIAVASRMNYGLRHLLPVMPLLYVGIAGILNRFLPLPMLFAIIRLLALETMSATRATCPFSTSSPADSSRRIALLLTQTSAGGKT